MKPCAQDAGAGAGNPRDARIAPTAHYTAYVWRHLGLPYADRLATRKGALLFWGARLAGEWLPAVLPRVPSMAQYLAMRHLLIEAGLDLVAPDRIVELGAGLSRRGVTWALDRGVHYIEVDLPHMAEAKRAALGRALGPDERAALGGKLTIVARDLLADDFAAWLTETLRGASRPAVVIEGVLPYFELPERVGIARSICAALARGGGGAMLCDVRTKGEGGRALTAAAFLVRAGIRVLTRGRGAAPDFDDVDAVRRFFADAGFSTAGPLDLGLLPNLARLSPPGQVWLARAPTSRNTPNS